MQVKIFESPDMATGLRMVRKELGPDALILSTRTIRSGKLGLLGKPILEITAATDSEPSSAPRNSKRRPDKPADLPPAHRGYLRHAAAQPAATARTGGNTEELLRLLRQPSPTDEPPTPRPAEPDQRRDSMLHEIDELKSMVKSLAGEISRMQPAAPGADALIAPSPNTANRAAQDHDQITRRLIACGINHETAATISGFTRESLSFEDLSDPATVDRFLHNAIAELVRVEPPRFGNSQEQVRMALIGPTGVGKTTTLAKIAANYLARHSNSIGLITIDTYRIAAVEQLKVYGEIMRLPLEVVVSPSQLEMALERFGDKELVLIDTAGRSPRDQVCIEELAAFLRPELQIETHLVLSAVTREEELLDTINRFAPVRVDRTIFTKIDECSSSGIVLNTQIRNPSPLSFLTNGQRVPEDLMEVDPETIAQLIILPTEGPAS